jgi:hypothetical protein
MGARAVLLRQLALDVATAEAVSRMQRYGLRPILLKGPVISRWLYADPTQRSYLDVDLLVSPRDFAAAESVLAELGYDSPTLRAGEQAPHEHLWIRGGSLPSEVDLHRSFFWARVDPALVWELVSRNTEPLVVGGTVVETPGPAARALILALHVAAHGSEVRQPLRDLSLALDRIEESVWREAYALARELDATQPFAAGLRLLDDGGALAERLGLPTRDSIEIRVRSRGAPPTSIGFVHLLEHTSVSARLRFLGANLFPSPAFVRGWKPVARRGPMGLAAAYAWRPLWLAWMAPRGFGAWRRARLASARRSV